MGEKRQKINGCVSPFVLIQTIYLHQLSVEPNKLTSA